MFIREAVETGAEGMARGLRRNDLAVLNELVERHQYRLVRYLIHLTARRESGEVVSANLAARARPQYGGVRGSKTQGRGHHATAPPNNPARPRSGRRSSGSRGRGPSRKR